MKIEKKYLDNNKAVCIFGNPDSGKTNLIKHLADNCSKEKKYTLGFPQEALWDGYINISSKDDIYSLKDCVLVVDELSKYFPPYEKKTNMYLLEWLSFCMHRRIKLIFATQITQMITRQIEALIPVFATKQINMQTLKNGGMLKNALKAMADPRITSQGMALEINEYVWFNTCASIGENQIYNDPNLKLGKKWG